MFTYYSYILVLSWMALGILCILVHENGRIAHNDKKLLYVTYLLIAASAFVEWTGVRIDGDPNAPEGMLAAVKCLDYILTPMAGGALVAQIHLKNVLQDILIGILCVNAVFQIMASFNGWMLIIDDQNHYSHGMLYPVYLSICLIVVILVIIQFFLYGRSFSKQNLVSLYAIMVLALSGIVIQEVLPGSYRTAYIGLTLSAALLFIHFTEFTALQMDENLADKQHQIDTDALTGLYSRSYYIDTLKEYDEKGDLPKDLAAYTIDINGLKTVNDTLGHYAGDELICGASDCIQTVFGENSKYFRTGGDEFVIFAEKMDKSYAEYSKRRLEYEAGKWEGKLVKELELSIGYALAEEYPGLNAEMLVSESDYMMYEAKAEYYRRAGIERRKILPDAAQGKWSDMTNTNPEQE